MLPIDLLKRSRRRNAAARCDAAIVLLVETVAQQQIIVHACASARAVGIEPGMALSVARSALAADRLTVEPHDAHRTDRALRGLAIWCHRFSPTVAIEDAAGICLDITGCAHLFQGEQRMLELVQREFHRLGFTTRAAIAPTFAAARAVARFGDLPAAVIADHHIHDAVRGLPLAALTVSPHVLASLREVNVKEIGSLLGLPRPAIAARFGIELLAAVDRLMGRAHEAIRPIRPVDSLKAERVFDGPCNSVETIGIACHELLGELCTLAAAREAGMTEWTVTLHRSDLPPLVLTLRHCSPSRDANHLIRLLRPRLERAQLGFGVDGVVIGAVATRRIHHAQHHWWEERSGDANRSTAADVFIDTVVNRLGKDAVVRAELRPSHVPEKAFAFRSVLDGVPIAPEIAPHLGDRPTRLFRAPAPIRVIALSPDGPVSRLEWRGASHTITACIGPERIKGEWWDGDRILRDYFKVQDEDGQWFWICRDHAVDQWFVHGAWV
jgi:protein ImuB